MKNVKLQLPALAVLLPMLLLSGCATKKWDGVTSNVTTVFGIEVAYNTGDNMPTVRAGLVRHENVRVTTNDQFQVLEATDVANNGLFTSRTRRRVAIGATAVSSGSLANEMPAPGPAVNMENTTTFKPQKPEVTP